MDIKYSTQWLKYYLILALFRFATIQSDENCLPDVGLSGDVESVQLGVETWTTRSSNFHWSDPERTSVNDYIIRKNAGIVSVVQGAKVRFYGQELCTALTKITELEKADGTVDTSKVCHKSCIKVGGTTSLDAYSGSGGRPTSSDPVCCFWGRTVKLRFSIPAAPTTPPPSYKCPQCTGCDTEENIRMEMCDPGERCYTLKTQKTKGDEVTSIKGCSSKLHYWGDNLDCDYGCKNNVPLSKEYGNYRYSVCVSCCRGNSCNLVGSHTTVLQSQFAVWLLVVVVWVLYLPF